MKLLIDKNAKDSIAEKVRNSKKPVRILKKANKFSREEIASAGGCSLLNVVVMIFAQQAVANLLSVVLQSFNIL